MIEERGYSTLKKGKAAAVQSVPPTHHPSRPLTLFAFSWHGESEAGVSHVNREHQAIHHLSLNPSKGH